MKFVVDLCAYRLEVNRMTVEADSVEDACRLALLNDDGDYEPHNLGEPFVESILSIDAPELHTVPPQFREPNADAGNDPLPRLAIIVEGGRIDVVCDKPGMVKLESLHVIDYDTEGDDLTDTIMVPMTDRAAGEAFIRNPTISTTAIDFDALDAEENAKFEASEIGWRRATWQEVRDGFSRFQHDDGGQSNADNWRSLCAEQGIKV